jgi:multidrug efflux pump subunit AcrB
MVELNTDALYAKQLSPQDISQALTTQNLILPAGTVKAGKRSWRQFRPVSRLLSRSIPL